MKKLLLALVAVTMTATAFADGHNMIRLDGCTDDGRCNNLDFNMYSDTDENGDDADAESNQTIALNYARSFGMWGAGLTYISKNNQTDGETADVGDKSTTIGLSGYYNLEGKWSDTCFFALHYNMTTNDDDETTDSGNSQTDIVLEYGHRYAIGKAMFGVTVHWSPSVSYTMGTTAQNNDDADDDTQTTLTFNIANFAAVF